MKNHGIFGIWSFVVAVGLLQSCGKTPIDEEDALAAYGNASRESSAAQGDTLIAENDTARFYLSGLEYSGITLTAYPTPQTIIRDSRYRMPTKLEVSRMLKTADMPQGYWRSGERILCYDSPADAGQKYGSTSFGSGDYYTYEPHGTLTKAGRKTKYCVLPIRTEPVGVATFKVEPKVSGGTEADGWAGTIDVTLR